MKRSKIFAFVFIISILICIDLSLTAKIYCRDECQDQAVDLVEDQICAFNGFYARIFLSRCHLRQHNVCFNTGRLSQNHFK